MLTVGLTGGIASGKSRIAGYLAEAGAECADADLIAHETMRPGEEVYRRVVDHFGRDILRPDGSVDRSRLAAKVFADQRELEALNTIVHPAAIEKIKRLIEEWRQRGPGIGVIQVPLLIEAGMTGLFDVVVVVVSSPEHRIKRLMKTGYSLEAGLARMRSQLSDSQRLPFADLTIINKGSLELLREQSMVLFEKLQEQARESGGIKP